MMKHTEFRKSFHEEVYPRLREILGNEARDWTWSISDQKGLEIIVAGPEYRDNVNLIVMQWLPNDLAYCFGYRTKIGSLYLDSPLYASKPEAPPRHDEAVNHPRHYGGGNNPYEAIKVIEAWNLDFHLGNTVKYISRAGKKNSNSLEDLEKARWYLTRRIENEKQRIRTENQRNS
jgi:hypothetical protein